MAAGSHRLRTPPRVFVSYRRDDAPGHAGRLHDALAGRFGADRVFMDVDDIPPGRDFTEVLHQALGECDVLLVLIGPSWATRRGRLGRRRLDDPGDFVRMELTAALERGVPVVPVLVQDARMPTAQQLPAPLAPLAAIQAFELTDRRWGVDLRKLVDALEHEDLDLPRHTSSGIPPAAPVAAPGPPTVATATWSPVPPLLRTPRARRVLRALLAVLGLAALTPVVAFLIGWVAFEIPSVQNSVRVQQATFTYADGAVLATTRPNDVNRVIVELRQVPEHVRQAVLAAEDPSFYSNPGFDLTHLFAGDRTITEKYVRASTGLDDDSLWTDYRVLVLAVKVSQQLPKDEILGNYLNTVSFGRGAYGIQAAGRAYFGKDATDLTIAEGALLAGTVGARSSEDPTSDRAASAEQWTAVLDVMARQGWVTPLERAEQPFPDILPEPPTQAGTPGDSGGHVYRLARQELAALGITDHDIDTQGLTVELTIDSRRQEHAVDAATAVLGGQPDDLRAALVAIDPRTGAIVAYHGGDDGSGPDHAQVLRRPGSSFLPFVLSAALQDARQTVGLGSVYDGSSPQTMLGVEVVNSSGDSCAACSVQTAMTRSVDTVFYRMGIDTGPAAVVDAAHQAGIPAGLLPGATPGVALGDEEVRPVDMASAFATFAADGVRRDPYVVARVTAEGGNRVMFERGTPSGQQAVPQQVARNVTEAMTDVVPAAGIAPGGGRAVAGKTGTVAHDGVDGQNTDAWMVGYTPSVSTAVWIGTDTGGPILTSAGRPISGRTLPGSIWKTFLDDVLRGTPAEEFSPFVPLGTPPGSS